MNVEAAGALLDRLWAELPAPRGRGVGSTESFLRGLGPVKREVFEPGPVLDRLIKKVESTRRVAVAYSDDFARATDPTPVTEEYLRWLTAVLLFVAQVKTDPKALNAALKLVDGIIPHAGLASLGEWADALVKGWPIPMNIEHTQAPA